MPHGIPVSRQCPDLTNSLMATSLCTYKQNSASLRKMLLVISHMLCAPRFSDTVGGWRGAHLVRCETVQAFSERPAAIENADD